MRALGTPNTTPAEAKAKRERLTSCMNTAAENTGVSRRKGQSPTKMREKRQKLEAAAASCTETDDLCIADDQNNTDTTTGGRRLKELLAVNVAGLAPEESRQHLRDLLEVVQDDDEDIELASFDKDDEDVGSFFEIPAAQLSPEDVEDFCFVQEHEVMATMVRAYANPANAGRPEFQAKAASASRMSVNLKSNGRRLTLQEQWKRIEVAQAASVEAQNAAAAAAAAAKAQGVRAATVDKCKSTFVKESTESLVRCDNETQLTKAIEPNYPTEDDGNFYLAVNPLSPAAIIKPTQGKKYKEYSQADKWGQLFLTASIGESAVKALEKVSEIIEKACDSAKLFGSWAGFGAGINIKPGAIVCQPMTIGARIALLALQLSLVDGVKYTASAAGNHDLILMAAEVEAMSENTITVVENQKKVFVEVGAQAGSTRDAVQAAADQTAELIEGLGRVIAALDAKVIALTNLVTRRTCDLQNSVAVVHNTANHVQRLLLIPDGTRPGYNPSPGRSPGNSLPSCAILTPATCSGDGNTTAAIGMSATCNGFVGSQMVAAAPLVTPAASGEVVPAVSFVTTAATEDVNPYAASP